MGMPCSSALAGPCCDEQHNHGTSTLPGWLQCLCAFCIIGLKQINSTKKGKRATDMQIHVINHSPNLFCSFEIILEVASQVLFANPLLIWEADAAAYSRLYYRIFKKSPSNVTLKCPWLLQSVLLKSSWPIWKPNVIKKILCCDSAVMALSLGKSSSHISFHTQVIPKFLPEASAHFLHMF